MKTGRAWRPLLAAGHAGGVASGSLTNGFSNKLSYMFAFKRILISAAASGASPRPPGAPAGGGVLPPHLMQIIHSDGRLGT